MFNVWRCVHTRATPFIPSHPAVLSSVIMNNSSIRCFQITAYTSSVLASTFGAAVTASATVVGLHPKKSNSSEFAYPWHLSSPFIIAIEVKQRRNHLKFTLTYCETITVLRIPFKNIEVDDFNISSCFFFFFFLVSLKILKQFQ